MPKECWIPIVFLVAVLAWVGFKAQGYCDAPGAADQRGLYYYRLPYANGILCGKAEWLAGSCADELAKQAAEEKEKTE